ncbi:hypothetical protein PROFUN_02078 [Planoprotostelium fungivorum]|uniref:Uncharacterized protein n=1 Tax=Planoprotostelium fungivorum TaxID=1890364 RepID=A0A2P6NBA5_9EUKA|nr:hypothetical protein PROFUN_02078 [Planoprotostelium fungivorum]
MGCASGKEEAPPPRQQMSAPLGPPAPRGPPAADTPEVIERKRREAAEAKKWEEEAKRVAGPIPPVPQLIPGASEEQYKKYMIDKFDNLAVNLQLRSNVPSLSLFELLAFYVSSSLSVLGRPDNFRVVEGCDLLGL